MAAVVHHGMPGHFIGAQRCCFRMHSTVNGRWKVSTVGCYHPLSGDQETPTPIGAGADALYETMVFDLSGEADSEWAEVHCKRYATEEAAERGHAATIAKYLEMPS